jgi:2-oxoacid:acceptor oxidoreductase gamma subunit (pyruvate/2-ketoisovalerate family)
MSAQATVTTGAAMELRLHGRGGQGGVTCAKILAAIYARLGKSVQTFGDYAGERSGAPVRAYMRVSEQAITNRNKVYRPDYVVVLDPTLLGPEVVSGLAPGGTLLVNTPAGPNELGAAFGRFRVATVDAKAIARAHGIGTRSVVIVNTTIAGAFAKVAGLPFAELEAAYAELGFASNLGAAQQAYQAVQVHEAAGSGETPDLGTPPPRPQVASLLENLVGPPPALRTGNWRTQAPRYVTHLAPCVAACPAGNDVIGFVQALAKHGEAAAAAVLGRTTPLSAVCGRVCPAPCMDGCNRRELDGAVNVRALERWIADRVQVAQPPRAAALQGRRIAIIGGGPAGLSAAYHLALAGHRPTIYEGEEALGGVLRTGIPTYRLPRAALDQEVGAILALGVQARCGELLSAERLGGLLVDYDAVIVATGLQRLRGLDGPEQPPAGVEQGIRFLHRVNMGGGVQLSGRVVVLGGGNTAMDCARSALRAGAQQVTVAYRRTRAEMPAIADEIEQALEEGVQFEFLRQPLGYVGGERVTAVALAEVELGPPDESGRRRPVMTDRSTQLPCETVLLALGQSADLSLLPPGWVLREGRFFQGEQALPVFAAGDVATGEGTVAHAIGDGRRAAARALRALGLEVEFPERPAGATAVGAQDLRLDRFERVAPAREQVVAPPARVRHFEEVGLGLEHAGEARRCLSCGGCTQCDTCLVYCPEGIIRRAADGYAVDLDYCKGCGLCVAECPRSAMEMTAA